MFLLRCLGACPSPAFLLLYVALSVSVMRGWRIVERASSGVSAQALSNLLLALENPSFRSRAAGHIDLRHTLIFAARAAGGG